MKSLRDIFYRSRTGVAAPETEHVLRAALVEPVAPGEDESYRRLMAVIAEDMRLRQPAPQRATWSWVPGASMAAAAAVFAVMAYQMGVDHGIQVANNGTPAPIVRPAHPGEQEPVVPRGTYTPEKPAVPVKPDSDVKVREVAPPTSEPPTHEAILARINIEALDADQRDLLHAFTTYHRTGEYRLAARQMERLAETDPDSELGLDALKAAADLYRTRLQDPAAATALYQRIVDLVSARTGAQDADLAKRLDERMAEAQKALDEMAATDTHSATPDTQVR